MNSAMSPEELYQRLGRLIEEAPSFNGVSPLDTNQLIWIGRAEALIEASGDITASAEFSLSKIQMNTPSTRPTGAGAMMLSLYRVLGSAELASPAAARGSFIPVGHGFDAYSAIAKVFAQATADILVVDPYMDDTVILDFAGATPEAVSLRLLTDSATAKASLRPAAARWQTQYPRRKLQVREAAPRSLHDRAILVDRKDAWTVTQSLKDLAKRSPAEIVRANDIAALKVSAYEQIWNNAKVIA